MEVKINDKRQRKTVLSLLTIVILIAIIPLFTLRGAEFGGSDDAGSVVVSEVTGTEYVPWFTPIMEIAIGGELPGEIESLLFCVQTGIGVGIFAFFMGRFVERSKYEREQNKKNKAE